MPGTALSRLFKSDEELLYDEVVIVVRPGLNKKAQFVSTADRTDPELRREDWQSRAAETLCTGLVRPDAERLCAFTILGCLGTLGMALTTSSERTDKVWDAIVHFITRARTTAEIKALGAVACTCDPALLATDRLHRAGCMRYVPLMAMFPKPYMWTVLELCRIFAFALRPSRDQKIQLWNHKRRARDAQTGRLVWPQTWTQLFPHGPESFRGVLAWLPFADARTFYGALFQIINGYWIQCPGIVVPTFVNSTGLVAAIVRSIHEEARNWRVSFVEVKYRLDDASVYTDLISAVVEPISVFPLPERLAILRLMPGSLLRAMDAGMSFSDEQHIIAQRIEPKTAHIFQERWMCFFLVAVDIMLWLPPVPERFLLRNLRRIEEGAALERESLTATPRGQLDYALRGLEFQQHCAARGCSQTFLHANARFRYCSACLRVPFCSLRCAKRAWRDPDLPHRAVCNDLRTVCHRLNIRRTHVEERFTALKDSDRPFSVEPEGPRIVEYLKKLRMCRLGTYGSTDCSRVPH
jgi:hypothetical protein